MSSRVKSQFDKLRHFETFTEIPKTAFESEKWSIPTLELYRDQLNEVRSSLSRYNLEEWSKHTNCSDVSSFVLPTVRKQINPEVLTRAFCKFYECLCLFPLTPTGYDESFLSLHLCEAPGGFVSALNHFLRNNCNYISLQWTANSLNPYYEGNILTEIIRDDRLILKTRENWFFGSDYTGDIRKSSNYQELATKLANKVLLVTADGSVDCMSDPGNQENSTAHLHYCETMVALSVLRQGGCFLLKIFTMFEHTTICLLYLLNVTFTKVSAFKPSTSKSGNSELYIICTDFKGKDILNPLWSKLIAPYNLNSFDDRHAMFDLFEIPQSFITNLAEVANYFKIKQIEAIQYNIDIFQRCSSYFLSKLHRDKTAMAYIYMKKFKLEPLHPAFTLIPCEKVDLNTRILDTTFSILPVRCSTANLINIYDGGEFNFTIGKKLDSINFSNFCDSEYYRHLNTFRRRKLKYFSLYNRVFDVVNESYMTFDAENFVCSSYAELKKNFIDFLVQYDFEDNLLLLNVPLTTSFFVGMFYALCTVYEEVMINLDGSIVMRKVRSEEDRSDFRSLIIDLEETSKRLETEERPEKFDVLEIVSMETILYNTFYQVVCNYNNALLERLSH